MRLPLLIGSLALLTLTAAPAHPAPNPFGLNVAWDQCYGDGGTPNRLFACNTNTGTERIVLSFVTDQRIDNVCGMEMYLQLASDSGTLPNWWSMRNAGTCRPTTLVFNVTPPNPASTLCFDWGGSFFGSAGIGYYNIGAAGPNTATTAAVVAVPQGLGLSVDPGVQYFTGNYVINHLKTVGTGSCSGCQIPVCILYSHMRLYVDGQGSFYRAFTTPANTPNSQIATWQSGQVSNLQHNCDAGTGLCTNSFTCFSQPVHSNGNTWGAVKALYR